MRLFLGTFLDKKIIETIPFEDIQKLFEDCLKPIKKENVHMTWIFLGNVEAIHELPLQKIIDRHINLFKGLIFKSKGLELWPPKKQPRLIVISGQLYHQNDKNKIDLSLESISKDLKEVCKVDAKENFIPHITIKRFKKDKTVSKGITLPRIENFIWVINEISLVKSILTSEGPNYERVKNWILS